jgi:hypothetical protein
MGVFKKPADVNIRINANETFHDPILKTNAISMRTSRVKVEC